MRYFVEVERCSGITDDPPPHLQMVWEDFRHAWRTLPSILGEAVLWTIEGNTGLEKCRAAALWKFAAVSDGEGKRVDIPPEATRLIMAIVGVEVPGRETKSGAPAKDTLSVAHLTSIMMLAPFADGEEGVIVALVSLREKAKEWLSAERGTNWFGCYGFGPVPWLDSRNDDERNHHIRTAVEEDVQRAARALIARRVPRTAIAARRSG